MADVISLFEYGSAIHGGATRREAIGLATLDELEVIDRASARAHRDLAAEVPPTE